MKYVVYTQLFVCYSILYLVNLYNLCTFTLEVLVVCVARHCCGRRPEQAGGNLQEIRCTGEQEQAGECSEQRMQC